MEHQLFTRYGSPWEMKAGRNIVGECSCSNPDDFGDGLVGFWGLTPADVTEQFADHLRAEETN